MDIEEAIRKVNEDAKKAEENADNMLRHIVGSPWTSVMLVLVVAGIFAAGFLLA